MSGNLRKHFVNTEARDSKSCCCCCGHPTRAEQLRSAVFPLDEKLLTRSRASCNADRIHYFEQPLVDDCCRTRTARCAATDRAAASSWSATSGSCSTTPRFAPEQQNLCSRHYRCRHISAHPLRQCVIMRSAMGHDCDCQQQHRSPCAVLTAISPSDLHELQCAVAPGSILPPQETTMAFHLCMMVKGKISGAELVVTDTCQSEE